MDWKAINERVIAEFRANGGRVAQFGDLPVLILHTIGARSGKRLEVPLIAIIEHDGTTLLYATAAGSATQPPWVFNLRANPEIDVELGHERFRARISELDASEAERRRNLQAERSDQFRQYLASALPRVVPVFRVERLD